MFIVSVIVTVRADSRDAVLAEFEKVVMFARTQQVGCISFTLSVRCLGHKSEPISTL